MVEKILNKKLQMKIDVEVDFSLIGKFCQRWKVSELALFGSILRDDFGDESDVDILVSFDPDATWSLFDLVTMNYELEEIFDREVDLVEKDGLLNPFRRRSILDEMEIIYAVP